MSHHGHSRRHDARRARHPPGNQLRTGPLAAGREGRSVETQALCATRWCDLKLGAVQDHYSPNHYLYLKRPCSWAASTAVRRELTPSLP
jgi:hypothetical protein